ncbi:unnamed protein product [Calypogeia fissa]
MVMHCSSRHYFPAGRHECREAHFRSGVDGMEACSHLLLLLQLCNAHYYTTVTTVVVVEWPGRGAKGERRGGGNEKGQGERKGTKRAGTTTARKESPGWLPLQFGLCTWRECHASGAGSGNGGSHDRGEAKQPQESAILHLQHGQGMRSTDGTKDRVSRAGGRGRTTNIDINQVSTIQHKMSCGTRAGIWKTWNPQGYEGGVSRAAGGLGTWGSEFERMSGGTRARTCGNWEPSGERRKEEREASGQAGSDSTGQGNDGRPAAGRHVQQQNPEEHDGRRVSGWGTRAGNLQNNDMGHLGRTWAVGRGRKEEGTGHSGHGAAMEDGQGLSICEDDAAAVEPYPHTSMDSVVVPEMGNAGRKRVARPENLSCLPARSGLEYAVRRSRAADETVRYRELYVNCKS